MHRLWSRLLWCVDCRGCFCCGGVDAAAAVAALAAVVAGVVVTVLPVAFRVMRASSGGRCGPSSGDRSCSGGVGDRVGTITSSPLLLTPSPLFLAPNVAPNRAAPPNPWKESEVVLGGDYVTSESGTGLVHIAPGHGMEDYHVGLRCGLPLLSPVDGSGLFTAEAGERFAGMDVLGEGVCGGEVLVRGSDCAEDGLLVLPGGGAGR